MTKKERERREKISEASKRAWAHNPERRGSMSQQFKAFRSDPSVQKRYSDRMRERMTDPEQRQVAAEASRKYWSSKKSRTKASIRMTKRYSDPDERTKQGMRIENFYADLVRAGTAENFFWHRMRKMHRSDSKYKHACKARSIATRRQWANLSEEARALRCRKISQALQELYESFPELRKIASKRMKTAIANGFYNPTHSWHRGTIYAHKGGGVIRYKSSWEAMFIELLDHCSLVRRFYYEPFGIPYKWGGEPHTYIPDFLVEYKDGRRFLVELKPKQRLGVNSRCYEVRNKFKAARAYCDTHGMNFVTLCTAPKSISDMIQ